MDPLIHRRHPNTGDFSPYTTAKMHHRFYDSWMAKHYTKHTDMSGLSDYQFRISGEAYENAGPIEKLLSNLSAVLYPVKWEREFVYDYKVDFRNHWYAPYLFSIVYVLCVKFIGPRMMANRKPIGFSYSLMYWNLFLAIFIFN